MNKIEFIGRLTKDTELKVGKNGVAYTTLSIAVNRDYKDEEGNRPTDFFDLKAFGKSADILHKFTTKGDLIYIEAQARQNVYEKEDGSKNYSIDFVINNFELLQPKKQEETPKEETKPEELPF